MNIHRRSIAKTNIISHVIQAARHPVALDDRQANAVAARMEIDFRTGAAFTRCLTLKLQSLLSEEKKIISYGL